MKRRKAVWEFVESVASGREDVTADVLAHAQWLLEDRAERKAAKKLKQAKGRKARTHFAHCKCGRSPFVWSPSSVNVKRCEDLFHKVWYTTHCPTCGRKLKLELG